MNIVGLLLYVDSNHEQTNSFIQPLVEQQEAGNQINVEKSYEKLKKNSKWYDMFTRNTLSGFLWNSETHQSSGARKLTSRKRKFEVVDEHVPTPVPKLESFEKNIMNTFNDIANVMTYRREPVDGQEVMGCRWRASLSEEEASYTETI
ncbi:hypothetical protein LXL04_034783 [Taraxacum kok-saghyz]